METLLKKIGNEYKLYAKDDSCIATTQESPHKRLSKENCDEIFGVFDVEKLAITQFPALLIQQTQEERETITMGAPGTGRRMGTMTFEIRGFVRGTELDRKRNDIIERIEETLDADRTRGTSRKDMISEITDITVIDRLAPLAEVLITLRVRYKYTKGTN
jgi:hypothetical protein